MTPSSEDAAVARQWAKVGRNLVDAFQHVYVIGLPRSTSRREHMQRLLTQQLGLAVSEWSFAPAVDCARYGRWRGVPLLGDSRDTQESPQLHTWGGNQDYDQTNATTAYWMQQRRCSSMGPSAAPPLCIHPQFSPCMDAAAQSVDGFRTCKYVCYSLSVASAIHTFLLSNFSRMLLLEDDVCLTSALLDSEALLRSLGSFSRHKVVGPSKPWSVVKLGGCYPCDKDVDDDTLVGGYSQVCTRTQHDLV